MGYNLILGCDTCRVRTFVLRGDEAYGIAQFAKTHSQATCLRLTAIDNGFDEPDWTFDDGWVDVALERPVVTP